MKSVKRKLKIFRIMCLSKYITYSEWRKIVPKEKSYSQILWHRRDTEFEGNCGKALLPRGLDCHLGSAFQVRVPEPSPDYAAYDGASYELASWKVAYDGSCSWCPDPHMGFQIGFQVLLWPDFALATKGIWGVNQQMKNLFLIKWIIKLSFRTGIFWIFVFKIDLQNLNVTIFCFLVDIFFKILIFSRS